MNIGWGELLVILLIVMLIVGAKRLPEIGRSLGEAVKAFQDAVRSRSDHDERPNDQPPKEKP